MEAEGRFLDGSLKASAAGTVMMQLAIRDALACSATLPAIIHAHLLFAFEELCAGYQPELLKRQKQGHDHPLSGKLREQAIRYLRWAADKKLRDDQPVKTIAAWYGVTEKCVKGWIKEWEGFPTPALDPIFTEETVIHLARFAGDRYPKRK